ncbi:unnamed protein product [Thelazia callipaeda]|uniref:Orfan n=1 Tax=Thelazia callipaeda TaxID=103827 RepID=A0A0N5CRK1_THECL|nr:unnamed protein product [Thelazia callipaeda]
MLTFNSTTYPKGWFNYLSGSISVNYKNDLIEICINNKGKNYNTIISNDSVLLRIVLNLWCIAECIATIPFFLGIWYPVYNLFIARIILDTLFIVLGFIYSITIAVYSLILYMLVVEMSTFIFFVFMILCYRCCKLLDNERNHKQKIRCKSLINDKHFGCQQMMFADGDVL